MKTPLNRRSFLKNSALVAGTLPLALNVFRSTAQAKSAQGKNAKYVMLTENDPQAKALGYYQDASKVDDKKYPKYATKEAKKTQFCDTCQLYKKVAEKKSQEIGTCSLFMAPKVRHVYAKGWCNSWVRKPKS